MNFGFVRSIFLLSITMVGDEVLDLIIDTLFSFSIIGSSAAVKGLTALDITEDSMMENRKKLKLYASLVSSNNLDVCLISTKNFVA